MSMESGSERLPRRWPMIVLTIFVTLVIAALMLIAYRDDRNEVLGANVWDVLTALGTLFAVIVAVGVAVVEASRNRQAQATLRSRDAAQALVDRRREASRVVGAVEQVYMPSDDRTTYVRKATLTLANDSDEPIFDVYVQVAKDFPPVPVGPLSAPERMPVVPARTQRVWDISLPMLAVSETFTVLGSPPTVSVEFMDSRGVRWARGFDGVLVEATIEPRPVLNDAADGEKQLGDLTNFFNPMLTALVFLEMLKQDPLPSPEEFRPILSPTARAWTEMPSERWAGIAESVRSHGLAAHAWYPARQVARVRTVADTSAGQIVNPGETVYPQGKVITLLFEPGLGWRVWGIGYAMEPDWFQFSNGALTDDPRQGAIRRRGAQGLTSRVPGPRLVASRLTRTRRAGKSRLV